MAGARVVGIALLAACTAWPGCFRAEPCVVFPSCPADAATPDTGPRACDPPASRPDPLTISSISDFRQAASELVCDASLRCPMDGLGLAQSYCHPAFADLDAEREGIAGAAFDVEAARACIRALESATSCDALSSAAFFCRDVSLGRVGAACASRADCRTPYTCRGGRCGVPSFGGACELVCEPPLRCAEGRCRVGRDEGEACTSSDDCRVDLACLRGACGHGSTCSGPSLLFWAPPLACRAGEACDVTGRCAPVAAAGACCVSDADCDVGRCTDGECSRVGHVGCPCATDAECPHDVSACFGRVCVARPFEGDPCSVGPTATPCFGSACIGGTCVRLAIEGEACLDRPCTVGTSCVGGVCRRD